MKTVEVGKTCGLSVPRLFHLQLVLFEMHGSGVSRRRAIAASDEISEHKLQKRVRMNDMAPQRTS